MAPTNRPTARQILAVYRADVQQKADAVLEAALDWQGPYNIDKGIADATRDEINQQYRELLWNATASYRAAKALLDQATGGTA